MSVTIMVPLNLTDEILDVIAAKVAERMNGVPPALQGIATPVSGFPTAPAPGTQQASTAPPFATPAAQGATAPPSSDPWSGQQVPTAPTAGWPQQAPAASSAPTAAAPSNGGPPSCVHGPAKWVPPGTSRKTGNAYQGFWACQAPRGQECPKGTF